MLIFEDKIPSNKAAFIAKVKAVADSLKTNPNYLMAAMYSESKFNPAAQNTKYPMSNGPATGLIQFTPDTAKALGTSIEELKKMNNVTQMDWVKKYFLPYSGKLKTYFDLYLSMFFPAAVGKPDNFVFETSKVKRSAVAKQNPALDENKDGKITVAEFKTYLYNTVPAKFKNILFEVIEIAKNNPVTTALIVGGLLWLFFKK